MTKSVHEVLIAARALIDTPEKWIKGILHNEEHTAFCAYGAVEEVDQANWEAIDALSDALPPHWQGYLSTYNDYAGTTHADILAVYDKAITATSETEAQP